MNQELYQVCQSVGHELGMWTEAEALNVCNLRDVANKLTMSVEFVESRVGTWIWDCQSIVGDITSQGPDPMVFLQQNDGGLTWCYFVVHPYDGGNSLNLRYVSCTPAGDVAFAQMVLKTVLVNMRKATLETRLKF